MKVTTMSAAIPQTLAGVNGLLDHLKDKHRFATDAALCAVLELAPPVMSNLRRGGVKFGATLTLRVHEICDMSVAEIKARVLGLREA